MAQIAGNEEKVFEYFLELDEKLRMGIIDEMQPNDRCRMTRCSKQCNKEAKESKNYIHGLEVMCYSSHKIKVEVRHHEYGPYGFKLFFIQREEKKFKLYTNSFIEKMWQVELDSSLDLVDSAMKEFRTLLGTYQKTVKRLHLSDLFTVVQNIKYDLDGFDSLENVCVYGHFNIVQLLSKIRKPLKSLCVKGEEDSKLLANCEQIYQVKDYVDCFNPHLEREQFLRFSAKTVYVHIGKLTEKDVMKFIRSWQNGTIGKDIRNCTWFLRSSNFDKTKFSKLFRVTDLDTEIKEIKHFKKAGKSAQICFGNNFLEFQS